MGEYLCAMCGHWFRYEYLLEKHRLTHREPMVYTCAWCGKTLKSKSYLKKHEVAHTHHVKCSACGISLRSLYALRMHRKETHKRDEKPFPCGACPKSFTRRSYLKKHSIAVHGAQWCEIEKRPLYDDQHRPPRVVSVTVSTVEKSFEELSFDSGVEEDSADSGAHEAYLTVSLLTLPSLQCLHCPCDECQLRLQIHPILPNQFYYQYTCRKMSLYPVHYGRRVQNK